MSETIKLSEIRESDLNPRKSFPEESIKELAESIRARGLLQPITVRKNKNGYEIIIGARRFRALQLLEAEQVVAQVVKADDDEARMMMIVENLQREGVHPLDEAVAMKDLYKILKSYKRVADALGVSQTHVARYIKLNSLIDPLKEEFYNGGIDVAQALVLCLGDKEWQNDQNDRSWGIPDAKDLKRSLTGEMTNLSNCDFDPADKTLVPKAGKNGSCIGCKSNTATDTLLFADALEDAYCKDEKCYELKVKAHSKQLLKSIAKEHPDFIKVIMKDWNVPEGVVGRDGWREIKEDYEYQYDEEGDEVLDENGDPVEVPIPAVFCKDAKKAALVNDEGICYGLVDVCTNKKCKEHWGSLSEYDGRMDSSIPEDELKHEAAARRLKKRWDKEDKSDRKQAREATLQTLWQKEGELNVTELRQLFLDIVGSPYDNRVNAVVKDPDEDPDSRFYDLNYVEKVASKIKNAADFGTLVRKLMVAHHVDDVWANHRIDQESTKLGELSKSHKVKIASYFDKYQADRKGTRIEQLEAVEAMETKWRIKEDVAEKLVSLVDMDPNDDNRTNGLIELDVPVILANNLTFGKENFQKFVEDMSQVSTLSPGTIKKLARKLNVEATIKKDWGDSDVVDLVWDRLAELRGEKEEEVEEEVEEVGQE